MRALFESSELKIWINPRDDRSEEQLIAFAGKKGIVADAEKATVVFFTNEEYERMSMFGSGMIELDEKGRPKIKNELLAKKELTAKEHSVKLHSDKRKENPIEKFVAQLHDAECEKTNEWVVEFLKIIFPKK